MARPRTIDREHLLDLAEEAIAATGAAGLSFGAVAAAAGLSKASVQSAFGTREALIEAMLERWISQEKAQFEEVAGPRPTVRARIRAHVQTTAEGSDAGMRRVATLLAAMAGSAQQAGRAVEWYASRVADFAAATEEERRLRTAFLAAEGAFFMRYLVGYPMSDDLWREIFEDLKRLT
ncbi:MAG: transcriptional regulator [Nitrosospira sp.]